MMYHATLKGSGAVITAQVCAALKHTCKIHHEAGLRMREAPEAPRSRGREKMECRTDGLLAEALHVRSVVRLDARHLRGHALLQGAAVVRRRLEQPLLEAVARSLGGLQLLRLWGKERGDVLRGRREEEHNTARRAGGTMHGGGSGRI